MPCLPKLFAACTALLAFGLSAGSLPCRGQAGTAGTEHPDSRIDLYGGYGYFHPVNSGISGFQYGDVSNPNATVSLTGYFNRFVGLQLEGGYFSGNSEHRAYNPNCLASECDQLNYTVQSGPVFRLPLGSWVPFVHMLGGGARYNGPVTQPLKWGWGVTGGIGIDYVLPFFNNHLAVRPIQADFQYSQVVYGPLVLPAGTSGGFGEIDALKLSGGLVARFGDLLPPTVVQLGCSAEPTVVHPGESVTVTGSTLGLNPKRKPVWHWESNGGKLTSDEGTATVDTTGLAPGEYTTIGHVADGRKAREQAACTVPFSVRPYDPPTLTCAATPATVVSGTDVSITTTATSPQNRGLMYSYTASAGQISPLGPTAKLSTAGLGQTTIVVQCTVVDDLGKSASYNTQVTVTQPVQPPIPSTQDLCTLGFTRDKRRPVRVDNEAKGCLDDIALTLNAQTDARLVMIGNASPEESPQAAAERVLNARQYMTEEKGIEPSRIDLRVGDTSGRTVRDVLVPSGAVFSETGTQAFDEKTITRHGEAYGKHHPRTGHTPRHAVRRARGGELLRQRRSRSAGLFRRRGPGPRFAQAAGSAP